MKQTPSSVMFSIVIGYSDELLYRALNLNAFKGKTKETQDGERFRYGVHKMDIRTLF